MYKALKRPNRRRVLGLAGGVIGGLAAPAVVKAGTPITWKMTTVWPKDAPGGGTNARRLAESIAALSDGRLMVQPFAAGELVAAGELLDAVSAGTVELGHGTATVWRDRDPAFNFFAGVPFGLLGHELAGWLRFGGGQGLWERAYEPFGVLPFFAGSMGTIAAGWFRNEIPNAEAFNGLRVRTTGPSAEIWRRLGADVVSLPRDEIVPAFTAGAIDAAEWMGPWGDYDLGLPAVAKNYYLPGFDGLGRTIELIANRPAFDALPADLRAIVAAAASASAMETYAEFTHNNNSFLKPLMESGIAVRALPDVVVRAAGHHAQAILKEVAATSPVAGETYGSFVAFRASAIQSAALGDREALRMRALALSA